MCTSASALKSFVVVVVVIVVVDVCGVVVDACRVDVVCCCGCGRVCGCGCGGCFCVFIVFTVFMNTVLYDTAVPSLPSVLSRQVIYLGDIDFDAPGKATATDILVRQHRTRVRVKRVKDKGTARKKRRTRVRTCARVCVFVCRFLFEHEKKRVFVCL